MVWSYYIGVVFILGCVYLVDAGLTIGGQNIPAFHNVNEPLEGSCVAAPGTITLRVNFYPKTCDIPVSTDPETLLKNHKANVSDIANGKKFTIESPKLKTYNIHCGFPKSSECVAAVLYDLQVTKTAQGFDCNLTFGIDKEKDFLFPVNVTWLLNEQSLDPPKSKVLGRNDFQPGEDGSTTFSFPLAVGKESKAGLYECVFASKNQRLSDSDEVLRDLEHKKIKVEPANKEQFSDGDTVTISCTFQGFPLPKIAWYHDGILLNDSRTTNISTNETNIQITSTLVLGPLEDTKDRGWYSCNATNSQQNTSSAAKFLHIRDNLAPVWPFLGILVQVILLAICIAVGEKFRKKKFAEKQRKRQLEADGEPTRT